MQECQRARDGERPEREALGYRPRRATLSWKIWDLPGDHGTVRSRAGGNPVLENTLALVMKRAVPSLLLLLLNAAARVLALTVTSSGSRMATSRTRFLADSSQAAVPLTATAACPSEGALRAAVSRSVADLGCVVFG
ncbi:unnamed protein product, partial [Ectocarpus sp. 12 AP-2014]